jgi:hypothetical protein
MTEPWSYTDEDGVTLALIPCGERHAELRVSTDTLAAGVCVGPGRPAELVTELYKASGQRPPVILDRPGDPAAEICFFAAGADLRFFAEGGRIEVRNKTGGGVSGQAFPVAGIRDLAARLAVLCDEAEDEPDPAEVDDLAAVLMEPGVMGLDGARPLARRILAAGYTREAGS